MFLTRSLLQCLLCLESRARESWLQAHDDGEWGLYAGIVGAGLAGMAAGNGARRFVASGTVLTMVVGLVFVSSALMLDAATTPPLLALYVALTAGAAAAWVGLRGRPALFSKLCCAPQRQL